MYICVLTNKIGFQTKKNTKDGCKGEKSSHGRNTVFCIYLCICVQANKTAVKHALFTYFLAGKYGRSSKDSTLNVFGSGENQNSSEGFSVQNN
jgi:hypothetical protein